MANNNQKFSWGAAIGMGALILTGTAVVIVLATFMFGGVHGTEFNPNTFERRRFGYYEIPLLRLQVTPLYREEAGGDLEGLVQTRYVKPIPNAPETWHLISFRRSAAAEQPTDARILARYLEAHDETRNSYWHEWSVKHPERAALLWPEVARLARLELYPLLPPLFECARQAEDTKAFQKAIRQLQTQQLTASAERLKKRAEELDNEELKTQLEERSTLLADAAKEADSDLQKDPPSEDKTTGEKPASEPSKS